MLLSVLARSHLLLMVLMPGQLGLKGRPVHSRDRPALTRGQLLPPKGLLVS